MNLPAWARSRAFTTGLKWAVAVVLVASILRTVWSNWSDLEGVSVSVSPWIMTISMIVLGFYMLGRGLVWHYLTTLLESDIPWPDAVRAWLRSQLGKYVPGKVFLLLGRTYYYKRAGRPASPVVVAFGVELLGTLTASVVTVLLALTFTPTLNLGAQRPWFLFAALALLGALHPRVIRIVLGFLGRISHRAPVRYPLTYVQTLRFVSIYTANWIVFGVAFYAFVESIFETDLSNVVFFAGSFSLAALAGMFAVFVPSGLGVREGVLGVLLAQVMPVPVALIVALAARLWFTAVEVTMAGAAVAWGRYSRTQGVRGGNETESVP